MRKRFAALMLTLALAAPAAIAEEDGGKLLRARRVAVDLAIERPLGLLEVAVGAAIFAIAYPISLVVGGSDGVVEACIEDPVDHTFKRPLGGL